MTANERDGGGVGSGDVTDVGGAIAESGSDTQLETKKSRRDRDPNWTADETQMLIDCKSQLPLPKKKESWKEIAKKIPPRNPDKCRQRWDTLKKSRDKIKYYCVAHGKEFSQVAEEEFLSMKLDMNFFTNGHWYKMIDDYYSRPTITSSGPAANELNGATSSTHPIGMTNLPSSGCPNLEVSRRPELMPAAFPVEQGPAVVAPAGWSPTAEAGA